MKRPLQQFSSSCFDVSFLQNFTAIISCSPKKEECGCHILMQCLLQKGDLYYWKTLQYNLVSSLTFTLMKTVMFTIFLDNSNVE